VLLQLCGLCEADIPFIAEVNENKFGRYTPKTNIPIICERKAKSMNPDYFLVLPWYFKESILSKEASFLKKGWRVIFPFLEIEII
jgi:hypothetical protein